jgi:hypothetical protein
MSKVGRNDACPCGSGKKYKRCCLERIESEERMARQQAEAERRSEEREFLDEEEDVHEEILRESEVFTQVDHLSEGVLTLIESGHFDEAEATARQLLEEFPDEPLGIERLGDVYEARGKRQEAADQLPSRRVDDGRARGGPLLRLLPGATGEGVAAAGPRRPGVGARPRPAVAVRRRPVFARLPVRRPPTRCCGSAPVTGAAGSSSFAADATEGTRTAVSRAGSGAMPGAGDGHVSATRAVPRGRPIIARRCTTCAHAGERP